MIVYPEGTITLDPGLWPMRGKTGAARIALEANAPVVPVGQWGAQEIMYGKRVHFPHLLPPKRVQVLVGDPVPLGDLPDEPLTAADPERGHRTHHDRHHGSGCRAARRGAAGAAASTRGSRKDGTVTRARRDDGLRLLGYRVRPGAVRCRPVGDHVGAACRAGRGDQLRAPQRRLLPDHRAAALAASPWPTRPRPWPTPSSSCWRCPPSRCASNLATWAIPPRRRGGQPGQGHRARHRAADERGDRRGRRRSRRSGWPWSPGPNLAREIADRQPSASVVASTAGRDRDGAAEHLSHGAVPRLHQRRRDRLRAGRGDQERHRARGGNGDRSGTRRQRDRFGDHPRAGRGHPAGGRARAPTRTPSRGWPAWATWWPPAPRRCRGTARSARSWVAAVPWRRSPPPPARWPRA